MFACWAVQNGVPLHELMRLEDWRSNSMVQRYAAIGAGSTVTGGGVGSAKADVALITAISG